jgi:TP901-1 family phage major tail protein
MAAQRGKDILIRLDAGSGFETVAGLRATRIALGAQAVDATTAEAPGRWRELLAGAGVQRASVSGQGVFKDAASDAALRALFFDGRAAQVELVIPDFGRISGPFLVTALEYAGNHDGEATFEATLESAGALGFAAI